ncbi:carbohydrate kinase family protein [Tepidimicrobium xylanilyticum]|uniref:Sugar or nucleoside kinase, ribokinase family n=1 Tax=Tepidimicrobium xylanilyticum TaxID=1123352 RepID=A0A1H2W7U5_9FIRM|nr:PfkB family carbohydrate kinase [Tepidimicrobium xylanilyticum]GMG95314.1 ribokinase [Tepidimicrobium xylanilyticum]SDW76618.1 Sugar or nucleoside kinase, ribokinase family [Tepidimicrobium xylanilyticum]
MFDVLCIGHAAYDVTLPLEGYPIENQKYSVNTKIECGGGPAANAAYLLSKWGIPTAYIGVLGHDIYGKKIIEEFKEVGTDISLVKIDKNYSTPYSTILVNVENGSRTIINCSEKHEGFKVPFSKLKGLNPKVILFDGHELETSIEAVKTFPHAITILDAGSVREGTIALAKKVDYLITSERFALSYCNMDVIDNEKDYEKAIYQLKELTKGKVVVTLGERGLIYEEDGEVKRLPAYKVKAVDTTGAGDIFHGAFAYGLVKGFSFSSNLKFSSLVSAISVKTLGGRKSIPSIERVLEEYKRMGEDFMLT